jgi:hypothetical protein
MREQLPQPDLAGIPNELRQPRRDSVIPGEQALVDHGRDGGRGQPFAGRRDELFGLRRGVAKVLLEQDLLALANAETRARIEALIDPACDLRGDLNEVWMRHAREG